MCKANQGSSYPALHRLEEAGWIEAEWGRSPEHNRQAKFYRLTKSGERRLREETRQWEQMAAAVARAADGRSQSSVSGKTKRARPPCSSDLVGDSGPWSAGRGSIGRWTRSCSSISISRRTAWRSRGSPATRRALRHCGTFGGVEKVREECREARRTSWADTLGRNTRYAWRALRRQPGYVAAVIVTLGLGIGANTAMFSVIDGVLLKPLPYPGSDRLVLISGAAPLAGQDEVGVSIRERTDYREQLKDFDGLVEFHSDVASISINRGEPDSRQHGRRLGQLLRRCCASGRCSGGPSSRPTTARCGSGAGPQLRLLADALRAATRRSSARCSR